MLILMRVTIVSSGKKIRSVNKHPMDDPMVSFTSFYFLLKKKNGIYLSFGHFIIRIYCIICLVN